MTSKICHLATRSSRVYEQTMLEHFAREFKKQEQVQIIKFAIIVFLFVCLFSAAIVVPLTLSQYLRYLFI